MVYYNILWCLGDNTAPQESEVSKEDAIETESDSYSDMDTADLGTTNVYEIETKRIETRAMVRGILETILDKCLDSRDEVHQEGSSSIDEVPLRAACQICGQILPTAR